MKYEVLKDKYEPYVKNIRQSFSASDISIWDRRNKIKIITCLDKKVTVKSFKIPHFINKIVYTFFRISKARRSYEYSVGIADFVPEPIGYVEFKKYGLLYDSYFLSQKYTYDLTIRETLTQKHFPNKDIIFEQFAAFTYELHEKSILHLDYSPGNILIKCLANDVYEFKIIDVNRMKFKTLTKSERLENFSKLWASEEDLVTIIEAYAKVSGLEKEDALCIGLKASAKHKHSINLKKRLKGKKVVD